MNDSDASQKLADKRAKIIEEMKNVTGKISDNCRFVGFGLLAVFYTIKSADGDFAIKLLAAHPNAVWFVGIGGFLAILFDYLQYLFASIAVKGALSSEDHSYQKNGLPYWGWEKFYIFKQAAIFLGIVALGWLLVMP